MYQYVLIFLFSIMLFLLSQSKRNTLFSKLTFFLSFILLAFFGGLRNYSVGTDTLVYKSFYDVLPTDFLVFFEQIEIFKESGFSFLEYMLKINDFSYTAVMLVVSIIVLVLYFSTIVDLSERPIFSFALFLFLGFYTFHFNAARQGLTVAIFFYSTRFIIQRVFFKYLLCILIGFLIHKTIALCLPLYFLFNCRFSYTRSLIFIFVIVLLSGFVNHFVSFATDNIDGRYIDFSDSVAEGTGVVSSSFWILMFLFFVFFRYVYSIDDVIYDFFLNSLVISVSISILSSFILSLPGSGILRLTIYFNQFAILIFPILINSIRSQLFRAFLFVAIIFFSSIFSYFSIYNLNGLYPYAFGVNE